MSFTVKVLNSDKLASRLRHLGDRRVTARFQKVAIIGCAIIHKRMVDSVKASPTKWRLYKKGKGKDIDHWSSIPFSPPNIDTGILNTSMVIDKTDALVSFAFVRVSAKYARWLEYGTKKGKKGMEPRPFMAPAVFQTKDRILRLFQDAVDKLIDDFNKGKSPE